MSCNCKSTIQDKLVSSYSEKNPEDFDVSATIGGYSLALNFEQNKMRLAGTLPVTIAYSRKNKKGETKAKTTKTFMFFNYCPFCGKSVAEEEA